MPLSQLGKQLNAWLEPAHKASNIGKLAANHVMVHF